MQIVTMEGNPTWLVVVAALVRDPGGLVLMQRALSGKRHGGMWEFPGGKVESEESPRVALVRELEEELGVVLDPAAMRPLGFADEAASPPHPEIVLFLYDCLSWHGEPEAFDGQAFGWFSLDEARELELAPMDRRLLESCFE